MSGASRISMHTSALFILLGRGPNLQRFAAGCFLSIEPLSSFIMLPSFFIIPSSFFIISLSPIMLPAHPATSRTDPTIKAAIRRICLPPFVGTLMGSEGSLRLGWRRDVTGMSNVRHDRGPASGGAVEVVEHPVHDDAGHRHVEPDRERPGRDPHVPFA